MSQIATQFVEAVARTPRLWRSLDFRVLAVRAEDAWHNIAAHGILRSDAVSKVPRLRHLPMTKTVRAWQIVRPLRTAADLGDLLNAVESGCLAIESDTVLFHRSQFGSVPPKPYEFGSFQRVGVDKRVAEGFPWPGYVITALGDTNSEIIHRNADGWYGVDDDIRRHSPRFRDLHDLAPYVAGRRGWFSIGNQTVVEWYAPLEVRLNEVETELRAGVLRYCVEAGSKSALRFARLSAFCSDGKLDADQTDRSTGRVALAVEAAHSTATGFSLRGELTKIVGSRVALTLAMGQEPVQWLDLRDYLTSGRNPRVAVYEDLDPECAILRDGLAAIPKKSGKKEEKDHQARFESAVARLLLLIGFEADPLIGDRRLNDTVDIIAHAPGLGTCLAIECTTGSLDSNGKLGKLVLRRGRFSRAAPDVRILAAIATSSRLEDLDVEELRKAGANGVSVLQHADLLTLLAMAQNNRGVGEALHFIESHVPPTESPLELTQLFRSVR